MLEKLLNLSMLIKRYDKSKTIKAKQFIPYYMNIELPLVSVVIITYNSEKTILETLESIKNQTYKNLELIISDDCSKDNTVEICKQWLDTNDDLFKRTELVESTQNTGVAPNLNRGIKRSKGEWIKSLAGDDTLISASIEKFVSFVRENDCQICVSDLNLFSEENLDLRQMRLTYNLYQDYMKEDLDKQLNRIYKEYTIPGPGFFYSRSLYNLVGGFDEKYPFCEEWPFAYKVLKNGYRFYPCSDKLVNYRISTSSLCREKNKNLVNHKLYLSIKNFYFDYLQKELIKKGLILNVIKRIILYKINDAKYKNESK